MPGDREERELRDGAVHSRVSRIEAAVESHADALKGLRQDNVRLEQEFREGFTALGAKIDRIATSQNAAARTNWGAVASWAGVSLTAIAFIGLSYVRPLEINAAAQGREIGAVREDLQDQRHELVQAQIHQAVLEERVKWLAGWNTVGGDAARAGGGK